MYNFVVKSFELHSSQNAEQTQSLYEEREDVTRISQGKGALSWSSSSGRAGFAKNDCRGLWKRCDSTPRIHVSGGSFRELRKLLFRLGAELGGTWNFPTIVSFVHPIAALTSRCYISLSVPFLSFSRRTVFEDRYLPQQPSHLSHIRRTKCCRCL